jgi:hypothetical protein
MFVLFPIMSVHQLMRPVSFGMKLDAVAVCGLGLAFGWICFAITRTWHSFFTFYEVDRQGIKARLRSVGTFYPWDQLKSARYRRALGQIEVEFAGT